MCQERKCFCPPACLRYSEAQWQSDLTYTLTPCLTHAVLVSIDTGKMMGCAPEEDYL